MCKKLIQSLLLLFFIALNSPSYAGTSSGGGGFGVRSETGEYMLLDLYLANPQFIDSREHSIFNQIDFGKSKSQAGRYLGYEPISYKNMQIYKLTLNILNRWIKVSPSLVGILTTVLEQSEFRFFSGTLPVPKEAFFLPPNKKNIRQRIDGLILFTEEFGPLVSLEKWNQLGDLSMVGFGIHEAFRTIQIVYNYDISDELIQSLTAELVLGNPYNIENKKNLGTELMALIETVRQKGLSQFKDLFNKYKRPPRYGLLEAMTMLYLFAQEYYKYYPAEVERQHLQNASEIRESMNWVLREYERKNK